MPGIAGIIERGSPDERRQKLLAMTQCLMHEPFFKSGDLSDDGLDLAVGWACHAGTFADCLPVWNETHDICLIFSGEDFADAREIESLRKKGHQFTTDNASYLVHQYEEIGLAFL
jgi:asparagine synthase (glutamine-hydrolysing)